MGKTKKKVVYNRGVSTVSVPAKKREEDAVIEIPTENATTTPADATLPPAATNGTATTATTAAADLVMPVEEWTPEMAEKHQLQLLMDKIRTPCDKEISRVAKVRSHSCIVRLWMLIVRFQVNEYERRLAKTMPVYLWAETDLVSLTLAIAIARANDAGAATTNHRDCDLHIVGRRSATVARVRREARRQGHHHLWHSRAARLHESTSGGVFTNGQAPRVGGLPRLGTFLARTIDAETNDYMQLFLHCDSSELRCEGPIVAPLPFTEVAISRPAPPLASIPISPPPRINPVPSTARNTTPKARKASVDEPAMIDPSLRAKILAYNEDDSDSDSAETSVIEDSEANIKWVGYKIQLSEVQRAQNVAKRSAARGKIVTGEKEALEAKVVSLGKKMKTVEADYMFRRIDAGSSSFFSLLHTRLTCCT